MYKHFYGNLKRYQRQWRMCQWYMAYLVESDTAQETESIQSVYLQDHKKSIIKTLWIKKKKKEKQPVWSFTGRIRRVHQQRAKCRKSDRITRIKMDHCKVHRGTAKRKKNFIFKKVLVFAIGLRNGERLWNNSKEYVSQTVKD